MEKCLPGGDDAFAVLAGLLFDHALGDFFLGVHLEFRRMKFEMGFVFQNAAAHGGDAVGVGFVPDELREPGHRGPVHFALGQFPDFAGVHLGG